MVERIVDIATDGRHLAALRGFLTVSEQKSEIGRIPLDDITAVIVHAHGTTYSNNLLVALAARNVPLVICASNHAPVSCVMPLSGHHLQGARMRAQWTAPKPLFKQAWRSVVIAKIKMQGAVAGAAGGNSEAFDMLARSVRSGDPENIEAQAARRYWPLIMGRDFRRDSDGGGTNALLNYGYTILRSAMARSIVASGLHPTIGIYHSNRANSFALADDLMEPFRPLVDQTVRSMIARGEAEVTSETKAELARLIALDLPLGDERSPVTIAMQRLSQSFARSCEVGTLSLTLPQPLSPLELAGLGVEPELA